MPSSITPLPISRQEWLKALQAQSQGHPGTMTIHGRDVDMHNLDEVRTALIWVSATSTGVIRRMQEQDHP